MKKSVFSYCVMLLAVLSLTLAACGGGGPSKTEEPNKKEGVTNTTSQPAEAVDKSGPEYTAHWICPMHCKGSGSEQAGNCPTCGMEYKLNPNHHH